MNLLRIAWRNIFRNKRRTFLTVAIMTVGIAVYIFGLGYVEGMRLSAFETSTENHGHIRIVDKDHDLKTRSSDLSASVSSGLKGKVMTVDGVEQAVLKLNSPGIIFVEKNVEKKCVFYGIEKESLVYLGLDKYVCKGDIYGEKTVLVGKEFAEKNDLDTGMEITLMTNTQYNSISALNFTISGIFDNAESIYNNAVIMSLSNAQYLLDMEGFVTEIAVYVSDLKNINHVSGKIKSLTDENVERWDEIGVNKSMISQFDISRTIFMFVFGTLTAVGILNTMMMIVLERRKEIGIMEANGLCKFEVLSMLIYEGVLMGLCGTFAGIIIGITITWYFSVHGLDFGESIKDVMKSYNMSYIIYPQIVFRNIYESVFIGAMFALIGTVIPVIPQVMKKPSELIKEV